MRLLAIDGASRLGWAVGEVATAQPFSVKRIDSGFWQLSSKAAPVVRWLEFWDFIGKKATEFKVDALGYESPLPRKSLAQTTLAFGFHAVSRMCAHRRELAYRSAYPGTVKKYFTGNGFAEKTDMIAQCHAQGWNVTDDNEADALALLDYLLWCEMNPERVALDRAEKKAAKSAKRRRRAMK